MQTNGHWNFTSVQSKAKGRVVTFLGFIQFFPATANTHRLLKFYAVSSPSLSIKGQAFPKQQTILGYSFQRMHGQHFTKVNNKSLGFVNEFKTKATSRYVKKTIASSPKRLFLNSLPCRKPWAKLYIPGEPGDLCPGQAPAWETRKSCEQGGIAGPKPVPTQGLSAPWERFSSLRSSITFHTPRKATQMNPGVAATAEKPTATTGTSARGPALQMDAAEEKLLTWIFEKDQGHCLQQEMTGSCIFWDKKKSRGNNTKPSPIFLLSPIGISCAFTTRDHGPLHPSSCSFSFYCKNLFLQHACHQPVWIPVLIIILLITPPDHPAIKHADWTSKNISLPIQKNITM